MTTHAIPESIVGQMIRNGHHKHGTLETLPDDRHCETCGATTDSPEATLVCKGAEFVHATVMAREIQLVVNSFGQMKSGKKLSKKVAKLYGKEMRKFAEEKTNEIYKSFEEHIKPRPKWMPQWFYHWLGSKFVEGL